MKNDRLMRTNLTWIAVASVIAFSGCGQSPTSEAPPAGSADSHEHPTEGPHHGSLIELGNEEYHAELVHDEQAQTISVYLLDSAAKQAVAIDAAEVTVNLSHDGQAEQFSLVASPESSDPPGRSSRYVSSSAELAEELDHNHAEAQLVATINGKQYRGAVAHDHDHSAHNHDHE